MPGCVLSIAFDAALLAMLAHVVPSFHPDAGLYAPGLRVLRPVKCLLPAHFLRVYPPHITQDRMHLDCVFSIVSDSVCIMLEEMMGEGSPTRRLVDEYTKARRNGDGVVYVVFRGR